MIPLERRGWIRQRSALNHDWLKNRFLVKLNAGLNLIEGHIEDPVLERQLVHDISSQWTSHRDDLWKLINDFERCMSPVALFSGGPLARCGQETSRWLGPLVHELWKARECVGEVSERVRSCISAADGAYSDLEAGLGGGLVGTMTVERLRSQLHLFALFRDRCQKLADSLSGLPSRMEGA